MNKFIGIVFLVNLSIIGSFGQSDHPQVSLVKAELIKSNIADREIYITDHYTSRGITHTYFKESIEGIPVFNSRGALHYQSINAIFQQTQFKRVKKTSKSSTKPSLTALEAIDKVVLAKNLKRNAEFRQIETAKGPEKKQVISSPQISISPISVKLQYYVNESEELKLAWEFAIEDINSAWYTDYLVDAVNGEILEEIDWTLECNHGLEDPSTSKICNRKHEIKDYAESSHLSESIIAPNTYEVYDIPVESPNFGSRTVSTSPWDDNLDASPNGWHTVVNNNYTTSRGNNTDSYLDNDNTNSPTGGDAARAEGGANLEFVFPLDVMGNPVDYTDAAITNTFFWTNLMHDVWYNYGFDEQSGNFQEENYSLAGLGSDYVHSEVQDGSGSCNANFGTPPDGSNPRMQMYLCNGRDGDFDNGVIAHEYGHGISNRLTGGPAASGCLAGQEQMGEGWSDYFGMVMTIESTDTETDARPVGTWLFGQGPNGGGIRPFPYSTDFGINPNTYDDIKTFSIPHGVGSVWCTMLWDMTWAFIDEYGFDDDMYNGTGGNNIAMALVMEGMKLQPCRPGFVDGRDAILAADQLLNNGANQYIIWNAFAVRGLGYSADQGSYTSRSDGTEAFDMPPSLLATIVKSTDTISIEEGEQMTYQITVTNNQSGTDEVDFSLTDTIPGGVNFVSASDGGTEMGGIITFPLFDLNALASKTFEVVVEIKAGQESVISDIYDGLESGTSNWNTSSSGSTSWVLQSTTVNDGSFAWFAPNNSSTGEANLDLGMNIGVGGESIMSFYHKYDTESGYDGGRVLISTDDGLSWDDLGTRMIHNGYNNTLGSKSGFSGDSEIFLNTIIDLSSYAGKDILVRFQMSSDSFVGGNGWWIDDIVFKDLQLNLVNKAAFDNGTLSGLAFSNSVVIDPSSGDFEADITGSELSCFDDMDGTASIVASGGSSSYTYVWDDGNVNSSRTGLTAGIYRVTVSDGIDMITKVAIVAEPLELTTEVNFTFITNETEDNGTATALPKGGRGPYTYEWSNGDTTSTIEGLIEGTYMVTVTDKNMCEITGQVFVRGIECDDSIFDSGGENGNYSNVEDITTLLCPPNPDEAIQISFNSIDIEPNWDALYIYNGNSINSPQFSSGNGSTLAGFPAGGYYGTSNPGVFTSTDETGCITLRFRSDQAVTEAGYDIDLACTTLCSEEVSKKTDDGWGSLRRTIECADSGDIIPVSSTLDMDTIFLMNKIEIDKDIKLEMTGSNEYFISLNITEPIFEITPIGTLEIGKVNLLSGTLSIGGAIINDGTLILNDVEVHGNINTPNPENLILNNDNLQVAGEVIIRKD
jgi:uncharacterized repeat protein (TIGR01451 family)